MTDDRISGLDTLPTPAPSDRFWSIVHDSLTTSQPGTLEPTNEAALIDIAEPPATNRRWRALALAAAFVLFVGGLVAFTLGRTDTLDPAAEPNPVIDDPNAIDLDPWRPLGIGTDVVGGPYELFDLTRLPTGWSLLVADDTQGVGVDTVSPLNPLDYTWRGDLSAPDGSEWMIVVEAPRDGGEPNITTPGDPIEVRGTTGVDAEDGLHWIERGIEAWVQPMGTPDTDAALALADGLVATTTNSIGRTGNEAVAEPPAPLLAGLVDGSRWWVDVRLPDVDGVPMLTVTADGLVVAAVGTSAESVGSGSAGLPGHGRIYFGQTAEPLMSIQIVLADQTRITVPVHHEGATTTFAIPIPFGLDARSIDFVDAASNLMRTQRLPPIVNDSYGLSWTADDPL